ADTIGQLGGYGGDTIVSGRWILAPLGLLLIGVALSAVALIARVFWRPRDRRKEPREGDPEPTRSRLRRLLPLADWEWPSAQLTTSASLVALLVLLIGAAPLWGRTDDTTQPIRRTGIPLDQREAELRLFSPEVAADLRRLPTDTVLLADPTGRNPYYAMALAPIYVVSSVPRHTATTPKNRVPERFEDATEFFQRQTSNARRLELLKKYDVTAIVIHPNANASIMTFLGRCSGITPGAIGTNQRLFHVDRRKLCDAIR
ncbi:MAG: hypothetical protein H7287_04560, partial [Thermoleophilia bacterium]|nr:hypothetical protein [Thermoleophilia bacterium]